MSYTPAVTKRRSDILNGRSIRDIAREAQVADSQVVRLLNGRARRVSYKLARNLASALGYKNTDLFYDALVEVWKSLDYATKRKA